MFVQSIFNLMVISRSLVWLLSLIFCDGLMTLLILVFGVGYEFRAGKVYMSYVHSLHYGSFVRCSRARLSFLRNIALIAAW